jgi:FkbM family methyltransferase
MASRWGYYLKSIPTLLTGVRSWGSVFQLLVRHVPGHPVTVRLRDGLRFQIRSLMDLWILKETCLDHDYEWNLPPFGEDWTVIDIGAGLGDFSVCAAWRHPKRKIAAFEPFEESFQMLQENLRSNDIHNVQAFPFAVGAVAGPMLLQTATGVAVQHSTAAGGVSNRAASLPVEGITLEEAFRKAGFPRCDILKMDCEGGEYDIFFHTAPETLRKVERIAMEYHDGCTPYSHTELADFLRGHGFSVTLRDNPAHRHIGFLTAVRSA